MGEARAREHNLKSYIIFPSTQNPKKVEVEVDMYFDIWKNSRIIENPM